MRILCNEKSMLMQREVQTARLVPAKTVRQVNWAGRPQEVVLQAGGPGRALRRDLQHSAPDHRPLRALQVCTCRVQKHV